ncbi:MAG: Uncharacterized protein G01um1014106_47 [Parcubacteria group bacterium Gr01-1014_106]|nr:MAG: Uncharacterized protein G01um1014106_47 [Parcubacteria group bacterium Gr01-1014_106]
MNLPELVTPNLTKIALFIVLTLVTFLLILLSFQPETVRYTALILIMIPVYVVSAFMYWLLSSYPRLLRVVKWIVLVPAGFVILVSLVSQFAPATPPQDFFITHNFIDLANVDSMSKYRSCHGHQTVDQWSDEPVSNMQHYIPVLASLEPDTVKIYAPFDGYVLGDAPNTMPDEGITMVPASGVPWWPFNQWRFAMNHTHVLPQFQDPPIHFVKAGTHVGYVNALTRYGTRNNGTQVRVGVTAIPPMLKNGNGEPYKKLDSVFHYMRDDVFAEYHAAFPGVNSRDDFIFPKEWRQTHPCVFREGDAPNFAYRPEENDLKTRFAPAPR